MEEIKSQMSGPSVFEGGLLILAAAAIGGVVWWNWKNKTIMITENASNKDALAEGSHARLITESLDLLSKAGKKNTVDSAIPEKVVSAPPVGSERPDNQSVAPPPISQPSSQPPQITETINLNGPNGPPVGEEEVLREHANWVEKNKVGTGEFLIDGKYIKSGKLRGRSIID
jgi:hypothetical protein